VILGRLERVREEPYGQLRKSLQAEAKTPYCGRILG
jgi:hypothetical protein